MRSDTLFGRVRSGLWRSGRAMAVLVVASGAVVGQQGGVARPRITGISHVGYYVSDLPKAMVFWHDFLGLDVVRTVKKKGGGEVQVAFLKVNDHEHVDLYAEAAPNPPSMLRHVGFTVEDVKAMAAYLRSKGFAVTRVDDGTGDETIEVRDPDGTTVQFVQLKAGGLERTTAGRAVPAAQISTKIYHLGTLVGNTAKSMEFYGGVLGFVETWRGGANPKQLSWINMRVPDGTDYLELMLYDKVPKNVGTENHVAMSVADVPKALAELETRPALKEYAKPVALRIGINQKRQSNLFDPDQTRVELMEERTVTGLPTPSSTAPPPEPAHE